MVYHRILNSIH